MREKLEKRLPDGELARIRADQYVVNTDAAYSLSTNGKREGTVLMRLVRLHCVNIEQTPENFSGRLFRTTWKAI